MGAGVSVGFDEEMKGFIALGHVVDYRAGFQRGKLEETRCLCALSIEINDIDAFARDPATDAKVGGYVDCPPLGGRCPIEGGSFNLLIDVVPRHPEIKDMRYRLFIRTPSGREMTLVGVKFVDNDGILHLWRDTTTLFTKILEGHVERAAESAAVVFASGILRLTPLEFATQLASFRSNGQTLASRLRAFMRFLGAFAARLWQVYGPKRRATSP